MRSASLQDDFGVLKETILSSCRPGPVYYYANPGNWGDALIRYATLRIFDDINLRYTELKKIQRPKWALPWIGTVIFGGGGAWCRFWDHSDMVEKLRKEFRCKVIILPSTFEHPLPFPRTLFFTRDKYESRRAMPQALFCHDMVFYLENSLPPLNSEPGSGKGFFFRTDIESSGKIPIPAENIDLSKQGNHFSEAGPFFDAINRFAAIYTDRLHVAIAGCLLHKEVHIYPGGYFKNRAVYLSSIKDHFDNVHFHENFDLYLDP